MLGALMGRKRAAPPAVTQVVSVLNRLSASAGGVTRVSLNRSAILADNGFRSCIVSIDWDLGLQGSVQSLRISGQLAKPVLALNFFYYYCQASVMRRSGTKITDLEQLSVKFASNLPKRRSRFIGLTEFQSREYMNSFGDVFAREILDAEGNSVSFELVIDSERSKQYKTRDEACSAWLEELADYGAHTVIISDASSTSDVVTNVLGGKISKVLTLHGNHFMEPFTFGSPIKPRSQLIIDNANSCDALVLLTESQKRDIEQQFGESSNAVVIPNSVTEFAIKQDVSRDQNVFAIVSRLEGGKRLDRAIRAFKIVVEQNPKLQLEIWGRGALADELSELISELDLEDNVSLNGYTRVPHAVYSRARCTLSTSLSEGFGLSIIESMSMGTPVISFNTNYGPIEIIDDYANGYLVESEKELAERILEIAEDNNAFEALSKGALATAAKYSSKRIGKEWIDLVNGLAQKGAAPKHGSKSRAIENSHSSSSGTLFISANDITEELSQTARHVEIIKIDRSKQFNDKISKLEPGVYRIKSMKLDEDSSRYAIKFGQGPKTHKGTIPHKSFTLRLIG
ncbi:glycosyltransferase [Pseudomonas sp. JR33AA]|uniref:glycosyltransferase n=1 Tax=Pseudomonas sp. JR33AA TaxID=2899113 RepID=UPI001F173275|nr:glycosyltransferase [Pseudomonas sp. JR33AA]MCE5979046.1 glycosyltransferase [Pseudomonas sp. JR33AA]